MIYAPPNSQHQQNFMVPPAMPENRHEYCEFPATDGLVLRPMGKINQLYTDYSDIVSTVHAIGVLDQTGPDHAGLLGAMLGL